jgi:hypothetical protein
MKTYPHVMQASRDQSNERREAASAKHDRLTAAWHAEYQILHMQRVGEHGLPDCYTSAHDFLCDFWADFPWNQKAQHAAVQLTLDDPRFPAIVEAVQQSIGIDLRAELRAALTEPDDE